MLRDPKTITSEALADYNLQKIEQDTETLTVYLYDHEIATEVVIRCKDYIGLELTGFWDDAIVRRISISSQGDLIQQSLNRVRALYDDPDGMLGCTKKTSTAWKQLTVTFIDGVELKAVCANIEVEY